MKKICCIFNLGPLYRQPIYSLMDKELHCDFYLGDRASTPMKKMDYGSLKGFIRELAYLKLRGFYRLKGMHKAAFHTNYKKYIVTGDPVCLSVWFLLLWARLTNKKVILWCHGWHNEVSKKYQLFLRTFYALSHHILLYGDYSRNFMIEKGISPHKLTCIYNSLDYDEQLKVRNNLVESDIYYRHFNNNNPVLLYIGRIQKRKRLDMIIESMAILKKKGVDVNFVCIGDNTDSVDLISMIEKHGLQDRVWLYGPLYDEQKKGELLFNANMCVSPGNVGLTAMDALNFGLPVITNNDFSSQMPEFEAIEDKKTGLFFQHDNILDLADKIEEWLLIEKNARREKIRLNCYEVIDSRYNPHFQINVLKSVLNLV